MKNNVFIQTPDGYTLNATNDFPDDRDLYYHPALLQLEPQIEPKFEYIQVLDQGKEGACTGFGLAAVINQLNSRRGSPVLVSARMLYEMAKKFDRWPGEEYAGSSCRGAIRGWQSMGVCREELWPYRNNDSSPLTVERAKDARNNTIGAYYRLKHTIVDFHSALNEVGTIYVSANVHPGWWPQNIHKGVITPHKEATGGHAFAIVGYNDIGFWVQNSWGPRWGRHGFALWRYEDWQANVKDAWVVRLALPTPQVFPGTARPTGQELGEGFSLFGKKPKRAEIAGHFVHLDDGELHDHGRYWSTRSDVRQTAELLESSDKYDHLLFYAHGGLNSISASARRIRAMKTVFKANRIYPFHFMYDTGILEEIKDVLLGRHERAGAKVAGFTDNLLEVSTRIPGRGLWREMKYGSRQPFRSKRRGGMQTLEAFRKVLTATHGKQLHLVGHSTGGIFLAYLIKALHKSFEGVDVESCSLLAPASTVDLFNTHYLPRLGSSIRKMRVYSLSKKLELDDNVALVYRKSLLYLVSRAFEEQREAPLLGMKRYSDDITPPTGADLEFIYSKTSRTRSTSHGGFDNDPDTMNDILKTVLGKAPRRKFTKRDLDY